MFSFCLDYFNFFLFLPCRSHQNTLEEKKTRRKRESLSFSPCASLLCLDELILRGKTCSASSLHARCSICDALRQNQLFISLFYLLNVVALINAQTRKYLDVRSNQKCDTDFILMLL